MNTTAQEWAAGLEPGADVSWRALEVNAFVEHPDVLDLLDPKGQHVDRRRRPRGLNRRFLLLLPVILLFGVVYGAPIWAYVTLRGGKFGSGNDPAATIPAAGVLSGVGVLLLIGLFVRWLVGGRRRDDGTTTAQAVLALVFGILSSASAAGQGSRQDVTDWQLWSLPIFTDAVLGLAVLILLRVARDPNPPALPPVVPLRGVRAQVAKLSDSDRDGIRRDLDAAIIDLARRGVITMVLADRARQADLGLLALHMAQTPRPKML